MAAPGDSKASVKDMEGPKDVDEVDVDESTDKNTLNESQAQNARRFWTKMLARELLAEFIGTFMIVQFGTGSVMSAVFADALKSAFEVAAVWFIGVTLAISCTASISGAHLNPSISLAFAIFRPSDKYSWRKFLPYVIAQLAGSVFASWVNLLMFYSKIRVYEKENNIDRGTYDGSVQAAKAFGEYYFYPIHTPAAFLGEAFGTAVLAFVIFSLTHPGNDTMKNSVYVPPYIGLCVAGLMAIIIPISEAGFNPARDFGPRIVAYLFGYKEAAFSKWWLYVLGPLVGAPVGALLADKIFYGKRKKS